MNEIFSDISKFTLKTSTCELCPSPLRTISVSIAIDDGTETRSKLHPKLSVNPLCFVHCYGIFMFWFGFVIVQFLFSCRP